MCFKYYAPLIAVFLQIPFALVCGQTSSAELEYQKALELNKSANYLESAKILKALMISNPEIERYKPDYIAVASNANLCSEVVKFGNKNHLTHAPVYVQEAIFSCIAKLDSYAKAEEVAKSILGNHGKNESIELNMVVLA